MLKCYFLSKTNSATKYLSQLNQSSIAATHFRQQIFITASCRLPFDSAFSNDSRLNLYFQHRCRQAAHCNHRHSHRLHRRALPVFALLSQALLRAFFAISFDDSGTKPDDDKNEKLLNINHKKISLRVHSKSRNKSFNRAFIWMVYLTFFIATSHGVKRGGEMSRREKRKEGLNSVYLFTNGSFLFPSFQTFNH